MMTRTELEYRRVWTQSLQLPDSLSERHMADCANAVAEGRFAEAGHHLQHAVNMHFPLALRNETTDRQPAQFVFKFENQNISNPTDIQAIVNASARTRVANRGSVAAVKYQQLSDAVWDFYDSFANGSWVMTRDDEYYAKCTWLMHVARAFGQYLDVHL